MRSAMPSVTAKRRCPDLIFVKPRFDIYMAVSLQIREIFAEYTPIIEPLALDEAYLDVTLNLKGIASATKIVEGIRTKIRLVTPARLLLDDALAGHHCAKRRRFWRALARTHSSMGNARISKTRETRHQDMRNIHH